ncbi:hypothetical protein R3P38DRAFT_2540176, partial [Favolaschia claudopus]
MGVDVRAPQPGKSLRFEDASSISQAPLHRAASAPALAADPSFRMDLSLVDETVAHAAGAHEEFQAANDAKIRELLDRQLGEELNLPARVKPPKLDSPEKYSGDVNDSVHFMGYFGRLATWMRAQFFGGPELDSYRVTLLKALLIGNAAEWFADYVEGRNGTILVPYDFVSIVCALHRRFITVATAQKASQAFDLVRYKAEEGPSRLIDNLITASRNMREPVGEFVIRQ